MTDTSTIAASGQWILAPNWQTAVALAISGAVTTSSSMTYGSPQTYTFTAGTSTTEVVGTNQPTGTDPGTPFLITDQFKLGGVVQSGIFLTLDDLYTSLVPGGYPYTGVYWQVSVTQVPLSGPPSVDCQDSVIQQSSFTSSCMESTAAMTAGGSMVASGMVSVSVASIVSDFMGVSFGNTIEWTNQTTPVNSSNGSFGSGMTSDQLPQLVQVAPDTIVAVDGSVTDTFLYDNGSYLNEYSSQDTLTYSSGSHEFTLVDSSGDSLVFHDFTVTPSGERGQLVSLTNPGGNSATVQSVNAAGLPTDIQVSTTSGGVTTTDDYLYTYNPTGPNAGLVSNVTLQRTIGAGSPFTVQQEVYTYYDGSSYTSDGGVGQLMLAQVEDASSNVLETSYFRYYTSGDITSGGNTVGYVGGLLEAFSTASYDRMVAAEGSAGAVYSASNATLAPFADAYYQFDASGRVTEEIIQGKGCSVCSGGLGTYTYSYTASADNLPGYNNWTYQTVETLPNGTTNTYYANFAGETLLQDEYDSVSGLHWLTYYQYSSTGQMTLEAEPSAVASYNDSFANLDVTLNSSSGLINTWTYYSSTTATTMAAGGVAGYLQNTYVQQGSSGTPVLQSTTTYIKHLDSNSNAVFDVAASTAYTTTTATSPASAGAETTTYTYTFYSGTNQIEDETTTMPAVTDQDSGHTSVANATIAIFDAFGRDVWYQDADGNIDYTAYDQATSAVVETIQDVSSAEATTLSMPGTLTVAAGSHLNLITTCQVDSLGRTVEETDPDGNATFTIYDDPNHEVRVYSGWIDNFNGTYSEEADGLPPTEVYIDDLIGTEAGSPVLYSETLTMAATPNVDMTSGAPLGKTASCSSIPTAM